MKTRKVVCVWLACLLTVAIGAALARADGPCRLSLVDTMLKHGQTVMIDTKRSSMQKQFTYQGVNSLECVLLASVSGTSRDSVRSLSVEEVSHVSYEKRGKLNLGTMIIATVGGAGVGALIGAIVGPVSDPTSDIRYPQSDKGPVAGAIAGGVVGLAAGTIIPLVLKRTYVIEF